LSGALAVQGQLKSSDCALYRSRRFCSWRSRSWRRTMTATTKVV